MEEYMKDARIRLAMWVVALIIGLGIVGMGFGRLNRSKAFENRAVEVPATVAQVQKATGSSDKYVIYIDYEYNGMKYSNYPLTKQGSYSEVGDKMTILVDPDNPSICRTSSSLSPASYALMIGGGVWVLIMVIKIIGEVGEIRGK